ncbi:MAG: hypothetical protein M1828_002087 [Chrysothrix sp. TS-e1954]|nr:MAG: hypothetical protein M1828_002087 [Chrysothrix sp. TS-e1954]
MSAHLAEEAKARLSGHDGPIHALTYSAGAGQYLLSGSSDRKINLYNPAKAISSDPTTQRTALVQSYTGAHGYEVLSIAVADDNARFVSGGGDKSVFLWDVSTARTLKRYGGQNGHSGRVECVAFGGEGDSVIVSGSYDASVRFWDTKAQSNRPINVFSEAKDSVASLTVAGHEIMTGSIDGRLRTYDLRMGMLHVDVIGQPITSVTKTLQADSILVSTLDSTLRLIDKANGKLLQSYKSPHYTNTIYRIRSTFAAKDTLAVSGSEDGGVYTWDIVSGECTQTMRQHDGASTLKAARKVVSAVACKTKGSEWASAGGDGELNDLPEVCACGILQY